MVVVVAEKLPPAVRGKMKAWFIEPTPHVFISSVSDALAATVADRLFESCPSDSSMLVVRSKRGAPGYVLMQKTGLSARSKLVTISGLQLVKNLCAEIEDEKSDPDEE